MKTNHGHTILCSKEIDTAGGKIILVAHKNGYEFITWFQDAKGECFSGNYFITGVDGLQLAIADYQARS